MSQTIKKMMVKKLNYNGTKALVDKLEIHDRSIKNAMNTLKEREDEIKAKARKLKADVQRDVGDAMLALRSRELALFVQIEDVEDHFLTKLQQSYDKCHQLLGSVTHMTDCAENRIDTTNKLLSHAIYAINRELGDKKDEPFSYWADTYDLRSAIRRFGVVESPPIVLKHKLSSTVSYEIGDFDHLLLYETLEKLKLTADTLQKKNRVEFPKLSTDKEDWLRDEGSESESVVEVNCEPKFILPAYLLVSDSDAWLKGSQNVALNEHDDEQTLIWLHPENLDDKTDCQASSCTSDSIEMISHSGSATCDGFTSLCRPIPSCRESLLADNKQQENRATSCDRMSNYESRMDKDTWLMVNRGTDLQIGDVCRANETCKAFSDCDITCDERAWKWLESVRSSNSNESISRVSWDSVEWLRSSTMEVSASRDEDKDRWLKKNEEEKMDVSEKEETGRWLKTNNGEQMDVTEQHDVAREYGKTQKVMRNTIPQLFGVDSSRNWLRNHSVGVKKCHIHDDFKSYFENTDTRRWLV